MNLDKLLSTIQEAGVVLSLQDRIYIAASNLGLPAERERIRRRLLKYKDEISKVVSVNIEKEIVTLKPPTGIRFDFFDGKLHIVAPYNQDFNRALHDVKGRVWDGAANTVPVQNGIRAIKAVETVFETYIEIDLPDAVFAVVAIDESLHIIKIAALVPNIDVDAIINRFGARYDTFNKTWNVFPTTVKQIDDFVIAVQSKSDIIRFLGNYQAKLAKLKELIIADVARGNEISSLSSQAELSSGEIRSPDGLTPYPFQIVGVKFIETVGGRALIADEMGLGKTVEALLYLYNHPDKLPAVIVVPSCVKINWYRETKKWLNIDENDICIISGKSPTSGMEVPLDKKVYILNYDIINGRFPELLVTGYKTSILDEAHYIKNNKAKRTKAVLELCKRAQSVICLTGTPITNRPIELWTIIEATRNTRVFGGFWEYAKHYCGAFESEYGWDMRGAIHLDELQRKLRESMMIRRLKADVLTQLPEKQRIIVPVAITNRSKYNTAIKNFKKWYKENTDKDLTKGEGLVKVEKLKQLAAEGKMKDLIEFITDTHDNHGKVIVFANHVKCQDALRDAFVADGLNVKLVRSDMNDTERQQNIDEFNEAYDAIIICSLKAAGVGINLQTASVVIFAELGWTAAEHIQAEDRAHRIGQTENVTAFYVISIDTIEEDIWNIIEHKQQISDKTIDIMSGAGESEMGMLAKRMQAILT